jgi:hypothetical protein
LKQFLKHKLGNLASASNDFALIIAILLNLFTCNAIWNSGKENESHDTAPGD